MGFARSRHRHDMRRHICKDKILCKLPGDSSAMTHNTAMPVVLSPMLTLQVALLVWLAHLSKCAALPAKIRSCGIMELHDNTHNIKA